MANETSSTSRDFSVDFYNDHQPIDISSAAELFDYIAPNAFADVVSGTSVTDLAITQTPDWENVDYFKAFLDERVTDELDLIERDFRNADLFGDTTREGFDDGFVTDAELVNYATNIGSGEQVDLANFDDPLTQAYLDYCKLSQEECFGVLVSLRQAARVYFNVLPNYLAQPTLTTDEYTQLLTILNYHGRANQGLPEAEQIDQIYGIKLDGFPVSVIDIHKPPEQRTWAEHFLIRLKATMQNPSEINILPEEWAGVRLLLMTYQFTDPVVTETKDGYNEVEVEGAIPFNHDELVLLSNVLLEAANRGDTFHGMIIAADLEKDTLVGECVESIQSASTIPDNSTTDENENTDAKIAALEECQQIAGQVAVSEADYLSTDDLYFRAQHGMLSASEVAELRTWMRDKAREYDLGYVTSIPAAISEGAEGVGEGILDNPGPFIASNVAFIGTSIALSRMTERAFLDALTKRCGGEALTGTTKKEALQAFRQFQAAEMAAKPFAQRMALRGINHWATGLLAFNAVAMGKDAYVAPFVNEYSPGADWMAQEYRVPLPYTDADFGVNGDTLWFDTLAAYAFYRMHNLGRPGYPNFLDGPGSGLCRPPTLPPVEVPVPVPAPVPEPVRVPNGEPTEPITHPPVTVPVTEPVTDFVPTYTTGEVIWVGTTFAVLAIGAGALLFCPLDGGPAGEIVVGSLAAARWAQLTAMLARGATVAPALAPVVVRYR